MTISSYPGDTTADSAEGVSFNITQTAHGFAVGDIIRLSGSTYVKAQADTEANAEVVGIVSVVDSVDTFTLATNGKIDALTGLTAGTVYYLSEVTSGAMTATEPDGYGEVSKPVFVADTTTSGYILNLRGAVFGSYDIEGTIYSTLAVIVATTPAIGIEAYATDYSLWLYYSSTGWKLKGEQVIARTTLSGAASSIASGTLPVIPNGFQLRIVWEVQNDTAANMSTNIRFNGDSGTNYSRHYFYSYNNGATIAAGTETAQTIIVVGTHGNESANRWDRGQFHVDDYIATDRHKVAQGEAIAHGNLGTTSLLYRFSGVWGSTAAITSVTLHAGTNNFVAGSKFTIFATSV